MEHAEASQLLVEYIKGTLSEARQEAIAAHVEGHQECAETVAFLRRLDTDFSRYRDGLLGAHPSADALVAHAVGDHEALEPLERESVARHVAGCAACFADLQIVRRVHAELIDLAVPVRPGARPMRRWLPAVPALAAGLLLGVVAPWDRDERSPVGPVEGPAPVIRLVGNLRDAAVPGFVVPAGARALPVVLAWDPWTLPGATPSTPLVVKVSAADGRDVLWTWGTTIGQAWDPAGGAVSFLAPAERLGTGELRLSVEGPDGTECFSARLSLRPR
jgi:anti-sigma factor RsiW